MSIVYYPHVFLYHFSHFMVHDHGFSIFIYCLVSLWSQVLPIFPRLVDLSPDRFQDALARILQVVLSCLLATPLVGIAFIYDGIS